MNNSANIAGASSMFSGIPTALLWIIGLLFVLILFVLVVLPLYRKYERKKLKVKETKDIKKDLMVWHHLAQLVRGGAEHQKAKQALSDQILRINMLFKQGLELLSMHGRKIYEQPWFLMVGEPMSGKSSLLRNAELELVVSEEEETGKEDSKSLPIRFWLGANAVVCDVNGHVFFDRWLNGSSAEWNYISKLFRRKRRKKPLDGIIVTIPADALLADDEALTQQKAILITTEIGHLLHTVGMHLPLYIVVTKTDMVNGFDEYIMGINEDLRTQIFGWVNPDGSAQYNAKEFETFWDDLVSRLHAGCEKSMISKNVATKLSAMSNKMEITGKIYLFPENFNKMYGNLSVYLRALFGEGNFHGADDAVLEGVFFTSAKSSEVTLSPSFAELCELSVEDAAIPHTPNPNARSFFIRKLLQKVIFRNSPNTFFTKTEQIRRNFSKYFACAFMFGLGLLWFATPTLEEKSLKTYLVSTKDFYDTLTPLLQDGSLFKSSLIKRNENGEYELNNDSIEGTKSFPRLQFFFEMFAERETNIVAPLGYKLSSLLVFGNEPGMGYDDKAFIHNQLYGIMFRTPVIKAVGEKLIQEKNLASLDNNKKYVVNSFVELGDVNNEDYTKLFTSDKFLVRPMANYLIPEITADAMSLLDSFLPKYDRMHTMTMDPAYIHSSDFFDAEKSAVQSVLISWKDLKTYPDSNFSKLRHSVDLSLQIDKTNSFLSQLPSSFSLKQTYDDLQMNVLDWASLVKQQDALTKKLETVTKEIQLGAEGNILGKNEKSPVAQKMNQGLVSTEILLNSSIREFKKRAREDFDFVKEHSRVFLSKTNSKRIVENGIEDVEEKILKEVSNEAKSIRKSTSELRENPLFQWMFFEDAELSNHLYVILNELYQKSIALPTYDEKMLADESFSTTWAKSEKEIKTAFADFDNFAKKYAEKEDITKAATAVRGMLEAHANLNRLTILRHKLNSLPKTEIEIRNYVNFYSVQEDIFHVSEGLAQEVYSTKAYNREYSPQKIDDLLDGFFERVLDFVSDTKDGGDTVRFKDEYEYYKASMHVFGQYLEGYISYWKNFPATLYVPAKDWAEYKERLETLKAYKVNSFLLTMYTQSINVLDRLDNKILPENLKDQRKEAKNQVNDQIKMLTPLFTDAAQKVVDAWGELPASEVDAWKKLSNLSEKELKSVYFNVYSEEENSQIAWWNQFTQNGVDLLRKANEKKLEDDYQKILQDMSAFPLCKNCGYAKTITPKQMQKLKTLLGSIASENDEETTETPESAMNRKLSLFKNKDSLVWASDILKIANVLTDDKNPLVWTLNQAPMDLQASMLNKNELSGVSRYRYVEVKGANKSRLKRYSTSTAKQTEIAHGAAYSPIQFRFYKSSTDEEPSATVSFSNYWAIFRLYLKKSRYYDVKTKQFYVPLTVTEKTGAKFIYFVAVEFNQEMLSPAEWPTKQNWLNAQVSEKED